jgi:outer membrane murein-binding lipoprotein Lpp
MGAFVMLLLLLIGLGLPVRSSAQELTTTERLETCLQVVSLCEQTINQVAPLIQDQANEIDKLNKEYKQLLAESQAATKRAWYERPSNTVPLSILLGVLAGVYIEKQ